MGSILYGLSSEKTVKKSPLANGRELLYFRCCVAQIDKKLTINESVRHSGLSFKDFSDYKNTIISILEAIKENATDSMRNKPYGMISTISRGYDAPSACALAQKVGCNEVFTFIDQPDDDGTDIAKALGYQIIHRVHSNEFKKNSSFLEAEALASGEGGATFIAFEDFFKDKILITGCRGDSVYERLHENDNNNLDFHVGNHLSQASLTIYENMLKNNAITIAIPLIGGDRWTDLKRISNSLEMSEYSVGENYDRPIARRLLEELGIKRTMFGQHKFGAGISYSLDTIDRIRKKMSPKSFEDLKKFQRNYPRHLLSDFGYKLKFYWINRTLYIGYLSSKLHLNLNFKSNNPQTGMMANPLSTMMLCWGIEKMRIRYKNYNI